jgi:hypothetical protein
MMPIVLCLCDRLIRNFLDTGNTGGNTLELRGRVNEGILGSIMA